jgi:protein TonB
VRPEAEEEIVKPELEEPHDEEEVAVIEEPQPSWGLEISDVQWVREPSSRDFARYFPRRALDEGQSGSVTLDCVIGGNGRLDCSVAHESPSGYGFGDAAINIARQTRVRSTLPDGSPAAGRHLRLPLSFRAG